MTASTPGGGVDTSAGEAGAPDATDDPGRFERVAERLVEPIVPWLHAIGCLKRDYRYHNGTLLLDADAEPVRGEREIGRIEGKIEGNLEVHIMYLTGLIMGVLLAMFFSPVGPPVWLVLGSEVLVAVGVATLLGGYPEPDIEAVERRQP